MSRPTLDQLYRSEYGKLLAGLIRRCGNFDQAEDALQAAFEAALRQWPSEGWPDTPAAWLSRTAQHKLIDQQRRMITQREKSDALEYHLQQQLTADLDEHEEPQDSLRLIFTCCHPALPQASQVALTLHTLGGLKTDEIARALLLPLPTLAQRLVRAKGKIRDAGIAFQLPTDEQLAERLQSVLAVLYLIFNEGYSASFGARIIRNDLCQEAIRLAGLLVRLLPAEAEARGLLALMLLHDSRRTTRIDEQGDLVLLEDQDRGQWNQQQIELGCHHTSRAFQQARPGAYTLQAGIAALHAQAPSSAQTEWRRIAALYSLLYQQQPTPIIALNRAVAIAMADGLEQGLALLKHIYLPNYHLLPATRADLLRRLGRYAEAAEQYRAALALVNNQQEQRFLSRRLHEMETTA
ncbi:MAG: sigma-70 family RNA polymerase sigma factor [Halopseudomonas sp.]|uniref:RNA polymerase sigma factor n=1 Tax=Halopseudomonas sp. TaxID=2901191 RepID=UPI003002ACCF